MGSTRTDIPWTYDSQGDEEVAGALGDARAKKVYQEAKESVTQDPITNPRSKFLKVGRYKGMRRWKKWPYRLIYGVNKDTRTIFPTIFDSRGNIHY